MGFTALVTLGVKSLTSVELALQDWVVVFYLAFVLLSLSWLIFDLSQVRLRQRVDLNRFLKWCEMEEGRQVLMMLKPCLNYTKTYEI
ncbi:MAG: hypothetical protein KTR16_16490 [Acidiferrobacterales bacterium]|nr:hypothetical protein [Acidiferrobacterales bacterium]